MSCGIYKMTNLINGKIYIGLSVNIETRIYNHYWGAFHIKNKEYDSYLSRAIRKYGKDNFTYEIIETCTIAELPNRERYWIAYYQSTNRNIGYNVASGGEGNSIWNDEDTNLLVTYYAQGKSVAEIGILLNKTECSVSNRIHLLGLRSPKYWTTEELDQLKDLVNQNCTPIEISKILDRTVPSIVHQMKRQNLKRKHYWTREEEALLSSMIKENYSNKEIALNLGRSESSIRTKRWREKI